MNNLQNLLNMILPPRCIMSGEIVGQQGLLSPEGWGSLSFIADPQCNHCGFPFDFDSAEGGEGAICLGCLNTPPLFEKARAAVVYNDASRDMILGYKHADQTQSVPSFMPWLVQAGRGMLEEADFIVPVPLHRWRLLRRRFNQAGLMAQYLSKETQIPCLVDALYRRRATVTQGHLNASERQKNVKNAFIVNPKYQEKVKGKKIILIDDVFTTGATVGECAKALLKSGAETVNVLTLARVVKPQRN